MANYLMKSDGAAPAAPAGGSSKENFIDVDNMYKLRLYNKSGSIKFEGYIPPDFSFALNSNWTAPFENTTLNNIAQDGIKHVWNGVGAKGARAGDILQSGMTMGGGSTFMKALSARKWAGPSFFEIDLPIFVDAYTDTKKEVIDNIIALLSLCAPSEKGGLIIPPGPAPIDQVANSLIGSAGQIVNASPDWLAGKLKDIDYEKLAVDDAESFIVEIGNFFKMTPAIIDSVSANFDNVWEDGSGNPISVDFVLRVSSYFAVTREDLRKWFKQPAA